MKAFTFQELESPQDNVIFSKSSVLNNCFSVYGGIVPGTINFITGNPGAGKTTISFILLNLLEDTKSLFYSREMDVFTLKILLSKHQFNNPNVFVTDKNYIPNFEKAYEFCEQNNIEVICIDSLQIILNEDYKGQSFDEAFQNFYNKTLDFIRKNKNRTVFIIGHVNKRNEYAGKTIIQHMIDTHLEVIYDKNTNKRFFRFIKNRFQGTGQIYHFEFLKEGISIYQDKQLLETIYTLATDELQIPYKTIKEFENLMNMIHENIPKLLQKNEKLSNTYHLFLKLFKKLDHKLLHFIVWYKYFYYDYKSK